MRKKFSRILTFIVSQLLIFYALASEGEDALTSSVSLQNPIKAPVPEKKYPIEYFSVAANGYPIPFLQGGAGIALEFTPHSHFSLLLAHNTFQNKKNEQIVPLSEQMIANIRSNRVSSRAYASGANKHGPFFQLGYKWGVAEVNYHPGFFGGPQVDARVPSEGLTSGMGYRFAGIQPGKGFFFVDLIVSYEPGHLKSYEYKITEYDGGFIQLPSKARLDVQTEYAVFPELLIGYHF